MKILHVIQTLHGGGAEKIVMDLHSLSLGRGNIDSHVVCFTGKVPQGIPNLQSLNLKYPRSFTTVIALSIFIQKFIRKHGVPDIIHTHLFPAQLFTPLALYLVKVKVCLVTTEHSTINSRRNLFFGKILDKWVYSNYKTIVCISRGVELSLKRWLPSIKVKMMTIHNGINLDAFYPPATERSTFEEKRIIVISVGRLMPLKNYKTALRAISLIDQSRSEYWIVGDGNEKKTLKRLTAEYGIVDRVKFLGWRDNVVELFQKADIFLLTSLWEGFGLVAAEAMATGLPVVVSNTPGVDEVVGKDSICGYLVDPLDAESFAMRLQELIHSEEKRKQMGINAISRAKMFEIKKTGNKYIRLYEQLIYEFVDLIP